MHAIGKASVYLLVLIALQTGRFPSLKEYWVSDTAVGLESGMEARPRRDGRFAAQKDH